ncbi:MAG: HAD family hydrolase [Chloroflexi bacterium]|nr:HAD family hydrolase [Chloroflexota bacterium]
MPLDTNRIRLLCFDVDGTLSDTDDMFVQRLEKYLHPLSALLPGEDAHRAARRLVMWSETPGNFLYGIPDSLGLDDEIAAVLEWINRRRPRPMKHFMLVPGVREMLVTLHKRYPLAVVSARDERSTRVFLDQFELTPLFHTIVTAQTAPHTKPYPDPILFAARALDVLPEDCLMIGDTTVDIRAGRKAGSQTVGVLCGLGEEPELRRCGADVILPSTADLTPLLDGG